MSGDGESWREVIRHDALAKAQGLSAPERLLFHPAQTGPVMARWKQYLEAQFD